MKSLSRVQLIALVGVALVLFASTRPWVKADLTATDSPALHLSFTGRQLDAIPAACALAAGVLFVVAGSVRALLRKVFGIIALACGVGVIAVSLTTTNPQSLINEAIADSLGSYVESVQHAYAYWAWLSAFGGVLMGLAGLSLAFGNFPERKRTSKYEREPNVSQLTVWQSLDHGIDPTQHDTRPLD